MCFRMEFSLDVSQNRIIALLRPKLKNAHSLLEDNLEIASSLLKHAGEMQKRGMVLSEANQRFQSEVRQYESRLRCHIRNINKHLSCVENTNLQSYRPHMPHSTRIDSGFSECINSPKLNPQELDNVVPNIENRPSIDPEYDLNIPRKDYSASNASSSALDQDGRRPLRLLALGKFHCSPWCMFLAYMRQMEVAYAGYRH